MKIHEYQAKSIIKKYGAAVPAGIHATTVKDALQAREQVNNNGICVVKAQIHAGGRGKGGGVKVCKNAEEFEIAAKKILGMNLVTPQTSPEGQKVKSLLIEEGRKIIKELYFSVLVDRAKKQIVLIASTEGGMDIEEVAAKTPEKILYEYVNPLLGLRPFQAMRLAFRLGLDQYGKEVLRNAAKIFNSLYKTFVSEDASLVEINPLVITEEKEVIALDCKMTFDENALYKHKYLEDFRDLDEENPAELEAAEYDLNFIKLDGNIGCMVNGAGLAMATMDIIKHSGGFPANFLDVGGGATQEKVEVAFRIITEDPAVKSILVNIFGGIVRCDMIAQAVINAVKNTGIQIPVVVRLRGTNADQALQIIEQSGIADRLILNNDLKAAAATVVDLAK